MHFLRCFIYCWTKYMNSPCTIPILQFGPLPLFTLQYSTDSANGLNTEMRLKHVQTILKIMFKYNK